MLPPSYDWIELLTKERVEWVARQEFIWVGGRVLKDAAGQPVMHPILRAGIVMAEGEDDLLYISTDDGMCLSKPRADVHSIGFPACYHCEERFRRIDAQPFINGGGVAECRHGLTHVQCMFDIGCEPA